MYDFFLIMHVLAFVSWMAGLLYLPRIYVYHCRAEPGSEASELFKIMERRLLWAIMHPAMIASWIFGLAAAWVIDSWIDGWFLAKLALAVGLTVNHIVMGQWRRDFAEDRNTRSERFYRVANEVPTLLMIGAVILVIVKPF